LIYGRQRLFFLSARTVDGRFRNVPDGMQSSNAACVTARWFNLKCSQPQLVCARFAQFGLFLLLVDRWSICLRFFKPR